MGIEVVEVVEVDPSDDAGLRAWWSAGGEADRHDRLDSPLRDWPGFLVGVRAPDTRARTVRLAAYDASGDARRVVGVSSVVLHTRDNTHLAYVQPSVVPAARRRGVGSALVAASEEVVRAAGRTTILTETYVPPGTAFDGDHPFLVFARRHGYAVAGDEEIKAADLLATEPTWPVLEALAAERLGDYRLVWWADPTPAEHVAELARLFTRFLSEIPLGEMDIQPQRWDADLVRAAEERRAATGRRHLLVAAVAPDGTLAGYSDVLVDEGRPERASIDSTLVLPEHRGHRLGLALKVRLHQLTREHFPEARRIVTGNAAVNTWMNAVNDQLGYVVEEHCLEQQKVLQVI